MSRVLPIAETVEAVDLATGEVRYLKRTADQIDAALPQQTYTVWFDLEIDHGKLTRMRSEEMSTSRRTLIALMGLAPASAALGAESFLTPSDDPGEARAVCGAYTNERFAQAFERMAAAARSGALSVEHIRVLSELSSNALADKTELKIVLVHHPEIGV